MNSIISVRSFYRGDKENPGNSEDSALSDDENEAPSSRNAAATVYDDEDYSSDYDILLSETELKKQDARDVTSVDRTRQRRKALKLKDVLCNHYDSVDANLSISTPHLYILVSEETKHIVTVIPSMRSHLVKASTPYSCPMERLTATLSGVDKHQRAKSGVSVMIEIVMLNILMKMPSPYLNGTGNSTPHLNSPGNPQRYENDKTETSKSVLINMAPKRSHKTLTSAEKQTILEKLLSMQINTDNHELNKCKVSEWITEDEDHLPLDTDDSSSDEEVARDKLKVKYKGATTDFSICI
ncbi:hypothetical protein ILUMI_07197 [Ignelater luminosus]|uniref:Uncharacterized protein n=1 Tax=Ignelater luminosus TaxID=2038154 RepID=A0A8K0GBU1_IGNLU|nr:hypothetical protein ILUMI_07197 [Ignelater luminosus]